MYLFQPSDSTNLSAFFFLDRNRINGAAATQIDQKQPKIGVENPNRLATIQNQNWKPKIDPQQPKKGN